MQKSCGKSAQVCAAKRSVRQNHKVPDRQLAGFHGGVEAPRWLAQGANERWNGQLIRMARPAARDLKGGDRENAEPDV